MNYFKGLFDGITFPENIKRIKLDIGLSYGANNSHNWMTQEKDLYVFGFEPNPDCLEVLRKGGIVAQQPFHPQPISDEHLKSRFKIMPVALNNVDTPGEIDFFKMQNDCGTSSIHQPIDSFIGPVKEVVKVPVYSLKHFFDEFPWDKYDHIEYIKIDAQGSDFDILKSAGDYLRERVVYVTAEPEMWQYANCQHNSEHNMTQYMESQSFVRVKTPNTHDPTYFNTRFEQYRDVYIYQKG
jgi:FkbM family methyltransferase